MKTGSGRVEVRVSANSGAARTAAIVVAGQSVTFEQRAATVCSFTVTPDSFNAPAAGASVSVCGKYSSPNARGRSPVRRAG